jgi:hypothetical protein
VDEGLAMDSPDDIFVAQLQARARSFGSAVVAIDVRASSGSYEAEFGRMRARLVVRAVLAEPGEEDSRYRVVDLDRVVAEDPAAARAVMEIAGRLASELGATLHPAGPEPPKSGDPEWLSLQGPSPEREWTATWTTVAWRPDGSEVHASGEGAAVGHTGKLALDDAWRRYIGRVVAPFSYVLRLKEMPERPSNMGHMASYPAAAPPIERIRAWAREGQAPSAILGALTVEAPGLSTLERMVALQHALKLDLEELRAVSAFAAGAIDAEELDAALAGRIRQTRPQWSMPHALVDAYTGGASVGPVLHAYYKDVGAIYLIIGLREAFDLSLRTAKMLMDTACSGEREAELDRLLAEALTAKKGQ